MWGLGNVVLVAQPPDRRHLPGENRFSFFCPGRYKPERAACALYERASPRQKIRDKYRLDIAQFCLDRLHIEAEDVACESSGLLQDPGRIAALQFCCERLAAADRSVGLRQRGDDRLKLVRILVRDVQRRIPEMLFKLIPIVRECIAKRLGSRRHGNFGPIGGLEEPGFGFANGFVDFALDRLDVFLDARLQGGAGLAAGEQRGERGGHRRLQCRLRQLGDGRRQFARDHIDFFEEGRGLRGDVDDQRAGQGGQRRRQ